MVQDGDKTGGAHIAHEDRGETQGPGFLSGTDIVRVKGHAEIRSKLSKAQKCDTA